MAESRRQGYLDLFHRMEPGARNAFRKIYRIAKSGDPDGRHVVLAMIASARHPSICKLSMSNLMIRMALKQALQEGDLFRAEHYSAVLEDFHAAMDEFMGEIACERYVQGEHSQIHWLTLNNPVLMNHVMSFKEISAPAVRQAKQAGRRAR